MEIRIEVADGDAAELLAYAESNGDDQNTTLARWLTSGYLMDAYNGVMVPVVGQITKQDEVEPIHVEPDVVKESEQAVEASDEHTTEDIVPEDTTNVATEPVKKKGSGLKIHKTNG